MTRGKLHELCEIYFYQLWSFHEPHSIIKVTTILIHPAFVESNDNRNDTETLTDNEQLVLNAIQMDATITMEKMAALLGISKATVARATRSL